MNHGLELSDLSVVSGGAVLLREVDLEVAGGSLMVVVGPSGAGKTTLLRAIAGLEALRTGSIRLDGRDLSGVPPHRRRMAVVFQEPRLFTELDVAENVAFAPRVARVPRAERRRRAGELLEEVGLAGMGARAVAELSGGEQQRVSLARALAARPSLLALDEPLAAVDPQRRADLRRLIAQVCRARSLTTVHVTHDQVEAAELGDRVALLMEGRIIEDGTPREVFERPRTVAAARFMGSTNVVSGDVGSGRLHTPAGAVPVDGPDGEATFTIRPEHVQLGGGPLTAVVTETLYQGGHVLVRLQGGGVELTARVGPDAAPPAGASIAVDLPRRQLWRLGAGRGTRGADDTDARVEAT